MTEQGKFIRVDIEEQMRSAYIDYSMSVIVSRALPDVRDGFKPVHRRIVVAPGGVVQGQLRVGGGLRRRRGGGLRGGSSGGAGPQTQESRRSRQDSQNGTS